MTGTGTADQTARRRTQRDRAEPRRTPALALAALAATAAFAIALPRFEGAARGPATGAAETPRDVLPPGPGELVAVPPDGAAAPGTPTTDPLPTGPAAVPALDDGVVTTGPGQPAGRATPPPSARTGSPGTTSPPASRRTTSSRPRSTTSTRPRATTTTRSTTRTTTAPASDGFTELTHRPASDAGSLRSGSTGPTTSTKFVNDSSGTVKLWWLRGNGTRDVVDTLAPGTSRTFATWETQAFLYTTSGDRGIFAFVTSRAQGRATVR